MTLPLWQKALIAPVWLVVLVLETVAWGCREAAEWLADRVERVVGR